LSIRDLDPLRTIRWRAPSGSGIEAGLPDITLITPSLNRAGLVGMAIDSAWSQGYPRLHQIIVDGGSTDGSREVIARYPQVEFVPQRSIGSHQAMNEGLAVTSTEIVAFLNTDDLLLPGVLALAGRRFRDDPALAALRFRAALFERAAADAIEATAEIVEPPPDLVIDELLYGTPGFNAWFFRRSTARQLGGFDTAFDVGADRDFLLRLHLSGARIATLPIFGYGYRRHRASRTLDHGARLRLQILSDHVAIARKALRYGKLGPADRRALLDWHGYETARLAAQRLKGGNVVGALSLACRGLKADPAWCLAWRRGRRRALTV
jgi:glycosyltransferase involved in cell wall biosynthesis